MAPDALLAGMDRRRWATASLRLMRIRQIRPEFWSDPTVGRLSIPSRLFYIGLWNVADDAGWLAWKPSELGALLYPYEAPARRERAIEGWAATLVESGRLVIHECGCAEVPTLPRHQRVTGRLSYSQRDKHTSKHRALTGKQSPLMRSPVEEGNVEEGNVTYSASTIDKPLPDGEHKKQLDKLADVLDAAGALPDKKANGEHRRPYQPTTDTEVIERARAVLADESAPDWKRDAARAQLEAMRVQP